jgi:hypothetical protein
MTAAIGSSLLSLYELPFGRGKRLANGTNPVVDRIVGGWVLSGIALFQSGPFMSVATLNDPSGTGYNIQNGFGGRADTVKGVNPYQGPVDWPVDQSQRIR